MMADRRVVADAPFARLPAEAAPFRAAMNHPIDTTPSDSTCDCERKSASSRDRVEQRRLRKDLKLLATFVRVYCRDQHAKAEKTPVAMKTHDVEAICGRPVPLCRDCQTLLTHAFVKRTHCPLRPKPACKKCPEHCYAARYRDQMRQVMKYSGRKLVMSGRVHYLLHLWF